MEAHHGALCCGHRGRVGPASPRNKALVAGRKIQIWLLLLGSATVMTVGGKLYCFCISQLMELKVTSISDQISETHDFPLSLSLCKKTAEPMSSVAASVFGLRPILPASVKWLGEGAWH